ncbi:MAG TPA: hypothetical protein VJS67_11815 [Pseudonocardiaceae bacterium]|nr:hypothetical protein [Pseudonocardiaceae bacterium]
MTTPDTTGLGAAAAWSDEIASLQRRTRLARGTPWFPLTLFGLLVLASAPLYADPSPACPADHHVCVGNIDPSPVNNFFPGGVFTGHPAGVAIFWLVAGPLGYLATGAFYWARARCRGVAISPTAYIVTGLALLALLVVTTWVHVFPFGNLVIRGLTPLITIAIGLFVLARCERSWPLATFAAAFLALALVANLYDMENVAYRLGLGSPGFQTNVIVAGVTLLLGGLGFGLAGLVSKRRLT